MTKTMLTQRQLPAKWYERKRVPKKIEAPSLTKQSFQEECDVNRIMKRFEKTGLMEHVNTFGGAYGDYTSVPQDYQACLDQVREAQEMFMTIPAKVRAQFDNDPGAFLAFVGDPANAEEMVKMGLANPPPAEQEPVPPAPAAAPQAPPAAPAAPAPEGAPPPQPER